MGERIMRPWKDDRGYAIVDLYGLNTRRIRKKVHRLVALNFVPNLSKKPDVNHIDGNKENNKLSNLEWVTPAENTAHAHAYKLIPESIYYKSGEDNPAAKLTRDDVIQIRNFCKGNEKSLRELSEMYGVHYTTIRRITKNEIWK